MTGGRKVTNSSGSRDYVLGQCLAVSDVSLPKSWRDLDRSTVGAAPDRYAVYELGDGDENSLGLHTGILRADLKEELLYGEASRVRWITAQSQQHADRLQETHR